jgi:hypothetical protein
VRLWAYGCISLQGKRLSKQKQVREIQFKVCSGQVPFHKVLINISIHPSAYVCLFSELHQALSWVSGVWFCAWLRGRTREGIGTVLWTEESPQADHHQGNHLTHVGRDLNSESWDFLSCGLTSQWRGMLPSGSFFLAKSKSHLWRNLCVRLGTGLYCWGLWVGSEREYLYS